MSRSLQLKFSSIWSEPKRECRERSTWRRSCDRVSRRDNSWCTESRHLIISISSIDSTPLLDFSDSPSVTSIAPAIHCTWDGQNPGKTTHRQSATLTSTNTITRREADDTGPNLKGTWKTLSNEIEKNSQACELATNSKILTNLTLDQKVGNQLTCLPPCEASISTPKKKGPHGIWRRKWMRE